MKLALVIGHSESGPTHAQKETRALRDFFAGMLYEVAVFILSDQNVAPIFWTTKKSEAKSRGLELYHEVWIPFGKAAEFALLREQLKSFDLILGLGPLPLLAITGQHSISKWRGSRFDLPGLPPAFFTYDYHALNSMPEWKVIQQADIKRVLKFDGTPHLVPVSLTRPSFTQVLAQLSVWLAEVGTSSAPPLRLSVDIETRHNHIACIGIGTAEYAICIPFLCIENQSGYWTLEEEIEIIWMLHELFSLAEIEGQNFIYDVQYIFTHWLCIPNLRWDSMIMSHLLYLELPKSLDFLASLHCSDYVFWKDDGRNWDYTMPEEQLWEYNCKDIHTTAEICEALRQQMNNTPQADLYLFQNQLWHVVARMCLRGVKIDTNLRASLSMELMAAISDRESWIADVVGHSLNIRSPKQMQQFFYIDLAQPEIRQRKTGAISCDEEALTKIAKREPILRPLVNTILDIRSLGVLHSTFIEAGLEPDHTLKTSFNIAGTDTFRFASSTNAFNRGANMQNVTKGGELASGFRTPNCRRLIIPDRHSTIFDIDLDRADLQVVVWEADDSELKEKLRSGIDLHTENAKDLTGNYSLTKDSRWRQVAKQFVHGTNYGGSARTMAATCGVTVHEADTMQKRWFAAHPGILAWHNRTLAALQSSRTIYNPFGYRRIFLGRIDNVLPEALAWLPQSTVACVTNRILVRISERPELITPLLQVHDSVVGTYRTSQSSAAKSFLHSCCQVTIPYPDPLTIPCGIKTSTISWGDVEEEEWHNGN